MNSKKELLAVIISSIAGGLIIGYGLWGGENNNEIVSKMKESRKAVEELSLQVHLLKKKLEQTPDQESDAAEFPADSGTDISGNHIDLKTLLESTHTGIPPTAASPQQNGLLQDIVTPVRSAESVLVTSQEKEEFQDDAGPGKPPEPRVTSPQKKRSLQDIIASVRPAESLASSSQRKEHVQDDAGQERPAEPPVVTALKRKLAQDGPAPERSAGNREKYHYLEFDYGRSAVTGETAKKLDSLINDLKGKSDRTIEITGYVDEEHDKEALRHYRFTEKLKTQKLNELVKNGLAPVLVDDIEIETHDYEKYLRMAYKAETFPKPTNLLGFPKRLSIEEMEKLMYFHINIARDGLKLFASQRALSVRDYIADSHTVNPGRLLLMPAQSLSPEAKENMKNSVVVLRITPFSPQ